MSDPLEPWEGAFRAYREELDEQSRQKGVKPYLPGEPLEDGPFESDEELHEFLADLYEFRHRDMA